MKALELSASRIFIFVDSRQSFKFAKPSTQPQPNLGSLHTRAVKFKYRTLKIKSNNKNPHTQQNTPNPNNWNVTAPKK